RTVTGVGRIAQGRGLRRTDRQRARRGDSRSRPWLRLGSRLLGPACPLYARTLERRGTGAGHEMKLTGERPMQGATPDSLLAFHDAGYREVVARLGTGVVVDVGCGVGDETRRLTAASRLVIGADYSPDTMCAAGREHGRTPGLRFLASDGGSLALRDRSV